MTPEAVEAWRMNEAAEAKRNYDLAMTCDTNAGLQHFTRIAEGHESQAAHLERTAGLEAENGRLRAALAYLRDTARVRSREFYPLDAMAGSVLHGIADRADDALSGGSGREGVE